MVLNVIRDKELSGFVNGMNDHYNILKIIFHFTYRFLFIIIYYISFGSIFLLYRKKIIEF